MKLLAAIVSLLVLAEGGVAVHLLVTRPAAATQPVPAAASPAPRTANGHPCNHGYYVSQAAHAKKGGKYVSGVAQGNLGKDGNCSAKLPAG